MNNYLLDFVSKYIEVTEQEKKFLLECAEVTVKFYPKGTVLLKEGQITYKSFMVFRGCIRIFYNIEGKEKTTAFYTEMEGLTPNCANNHKPSEYYIDCLEDCLIASSTPEIEMKFNKQFPRFEIVCKMVSEEQVFRQALEINSFKILNPEQRYIKLQEDRPDLIQRVPQQHIASFLGITPQSLSRIRARLKDKTSSVTC